jgi:hypothetical protein
MIAFAVVIARQQVQSRSHNLHHSHV